MAIFDNQHMSLSSTTNWRDRIAVELRTLTLLNILVAIQLGAALLYGRYYDVFVSSLTRYLLPFIWITSGLWAIVNATPKPRDRVHRIVGGVVGGSYFLVLLFISGLAGPVTPQLHSASAGTWDVTLRVALGWGPVISYTGDYLYLTIVPFQVIGYGALAYIFYVAVLDVTNAAVGGIVGLIPCPGCAAPLLTPVLAGALGTSPGIVLLVSFAYEIATVFFLGALALLYWRPPLERIVPRRRSRPSK